MRTRRSTLIRAWLARRAAASTCPMHTPEHRNGCPDDRCRCTHRNVSPITGTTDVWCNDCRYQLS